MRTKSAEDLPASSLIGQLDKTPVLSVFNYIKASLDSMLAVLLPLPQARPGAAGRASIQTMMVTAR